MGHVLKRILSVLAAAFVFCGMPAAAQSLDKALDEYEALLNEALYMKRRTAAGEKVEQYELYGLSLRLSEIRKTLSGADSGMSDAQKSRFEAIRRWYAAAENGSSAPSPVWLAPARTYNITLDCDQGVFAVPATQAKSAQYGIHPFVSFTISGFDAFTPGLRAGAIRKSWGAYAALRLSGGNKNAAYDCLADGSIPNGGSIYTNGEQSVWHFGVSAGALWLPFRFDGLDSGRAGLYFGAGYGKRNLYWQDINGGWARVSDRSWSGPSAEAGAAAFWHRFFLSAGLSTITFSHLDFELGLGLRF